MGILLRNLKHSAHDSSIHFCEFHVIMDKSFSNWDARQCRVLPYFLALYGCIGKIIPGQYKCNFNFFNIFFSEKRPANNLSFCSPTTLSLSISGGTRHHCSSTSLIIIIDNHLHKATYPFFAILRILYVFFFGLLIDNFFFCK